MKLSFLPGNLHLSQNADGFFVLTREGREILSTKSEKAALGKFHSLRMELEREFPFQPPKIEKPVVSQTELPEKKWLEHSFRKPSASVQPRISPTALFEIEVALREYFNAVETSGLGFNSQAQYIDMADRFVRWLKRGFSPGSRMVP